MPSPNHTPTVAVISATIGREELQRAINSVQSQNYPCKHYVFVDGEQYYSNARHILAQYPDVCAIYLPMNTGKDGWYNSRICAIAPFLVNEDIVCFLDDDNTYLPNHIESIVATFKQNESLDYVYSMRNFVKQNGEYLCQDKTESIGLYQRSFPSKFDGIFRFKDKEIKTTHTITSPFIDVNCYAFKRQIAYKLAEAWNLKGYGNDKQVFRFLQHHQMKGEWSGQFSVNYTIKPKKINSGHLWNFLTQYESNEQDINEVIYSFVKKINESSHISRQ